LPALELGRQARDDGWTSVSTVLIAYFGSLTMSRAFSLFVVALLTFSVGCGKSDTKSATASNNSDNSGPKIVDPAVQQAAATVETPAEKPPEVIQASATERSEKPKDMTPGIGDKGPAWEALAGTDDKEHSLKDLEKAKAVAVIFTCNTCPVAVAYEDRMIKLTNDYKNKGVALVAINVNKDDRNSMEAMKERAEKKGFTFPYLFDPTQKIARDYGAKVTPHVFLLDQERKIAYMGAIDDNMKEDAVKVNGLKDALDAVLDGRKPEVATTKQHGCGIRYE
jgi:peroxiredoxin